LAMIGHHTPMIGHDWSSDTHDWPWLVIRHPWLAFGLTPTAFTEVCEALASFWYATLYAINENLFLIMTFDLEGVTRLCPSQNSTWHFAWSTDWRKQNSKKSNGSKVIVPTDDRRQTTDDRHCDSIIYLKVDNNGDVRQVVCEEQSG